MRFKLLGIAAGAGNGCLLASGRRRRRRRWNLEITFLRLNFRILADDLAAPSCSYTICMLARIKSHNPTTGL
jgi:hypothetical protein